MALRIALFGQAEFGRDVLERLQEERHRVVGVYTPPAGARPDLLAEAATTRGIPLFRHKRFRRKRGEAFEPVPEILEEYAGQAADLNVLAYVTAILPPEIVDAPPRGSLCFHPSLLPRFRGGAALAWQIILGERESGVTVFRPDAGVDTGPIVVQKGGVAIEDTDTAGSLYFGKLYPLGVDAVVEAVAAVADGSARYQHQDESRASFQGLVGDAEARLDWSRSAPELDRWIRGCDPQPGAWCERGGERVRLYGGRVVPGAGDAPPGTVVALDEQGLWLAARSGRLVIGRLRVGGGPKLAAVEAGLRPGERLA